MEFQVEVTYLDHMGSDHMVVNAARTSFAKRKEVFDDKDAKLIKYLAEHKHVLPFRHPHVSFHFKAPIFVARQLVKHQVGMSWSEISRRYVVGGLEFYWPTEWREVAPDKKQGSKDTGIAQQRDAESVAQAGAAAAVDAYEALVDMGVAPEQARMVLPLNLYSEWHWTGSLLAWAHVWNLRTEAHAQKECQDCVRLIGPKMKELFPVSWGVLTGGE